MDLHFVLVGLQALKGLLVVTLVGADAFLGGKIPSGGIEGSLLVGQFLVEDAAPVAVTRLLGARIDLRKPAAEGDALFWGVAAGREGPGPGTEETA